MIVRMLACDAPRCHATMTPPQQGTTDVDLRAWAKRCGWSYCYAREIGRMVDLCPIHREAPLDTPEAEL